MSRRSMPNIRALVAVGLLLPAGGPEPARAAPAQAAEAPAEETSLKTAGAHYRAGRVHRFLFGNDYRNLWTAPVRVEFLDLEAFAGGLTPVRRVGAGQSAGLALRGADGRAYTFRGVEKDATRGLPPDLRRTIAGRIAQDQTAAVHPGATVVATPLLEAAGVLHVEPHLVVMPDDARLGEFRADFAEVLGTIQEYPLPADGRQPGFAGATGIVDSKELLKRLHASSGERVDARAYLRARLMDLFLGDWDRHLGQWRWAKVPGQPGWQPLPEDRDFAFCRFEGAVLGITRNWYPRWVTFEDDYPDMLGITWQAWPLDRELLSELERPAWDEIAADLQRRLTDEVIEAAVRRLPEAYVEVDGARLAKGLRKRRDRLAEAAGDYYRHLAEEVRIEGTDEPEVAEAIAGDDGGLEVNVYRADASGAPVGEAWFRRRFRARDTREVRIELRGGDDRFVARGRSEIRVRVVGGEGDDVLDDSAGGRADLLDAEGRNRIERGPGTRVDARPYTPPPLESEYPYMPARDWGRQTTYLPWFAASPDLGLFLGAGIQLDRYAFRTYPYRRSQVLRVGYATAPSGFRGVYVGEFRSANTDLYLTVAARASQIELLNFFGFGNDSDPQGPSSSFEVRQTQLALAPLLTVPATRHLTLAFGPTLDHSWTDNPPTDPITGEHRYGSDPFGELGALALVRLDTRDLAESATRGVYVLVAGAFHPAVWDVEQRFGEVHAEASTYLTARIPLRPTLALRAGGRLVLGGYPFQEAAFIGGSDTVRGFSSQRFAGDSSAWGNAELRLRLGRFFFVLPGQYGLFALADTGRVWFAGEDSNSWHTGVGGGLWFAYLDPRNTVTVAVARSAEKTGFYVQMGFGF